jgi:hypothetical protein
MYIRPYRRLSQSGLVLYNDVVFCWATLVSLHFLGFYLVAALGRLNMYFLVLGSYITCVVVNLHLNREITHLISHSHI